MFYDAVANTHGLRWDPFKALVSPRPIGWISTLGANGVVNLAPYSFFNAVSTDPHYVMFSSGGRKDSQRNAEETGEFVCSLATYDLRDAMNRTSQHVAPEVDEMALAGLTPAPSKLVAPPRVAESPVAFECKLLETKSFGNSTVVFGRVVFAAVAEEVLDGELPEVELLRPLARLGKAEWAELGTVRRIRRIPHSDWPGHYASEE